MVRYLHVRIQVNAHWNIPERQHDVQYVAAFATWVAENMAQMDRDMGLLNQPMVWVQWCHFFGQFPCVRQRRKEHKKPQCLTIC